MEEEIRKIEKDGLNDVEGGNYSEDSSFEEPFQDSSSDALLPSNSDTESEHQLRDSVDEASMDVEGRDDGNNERNNDDWVDVQENPLLFDFSGQKVSKLICLRLLLHWKHFHYTSPY
ncbi:hypothetical protein QE152_g34372 [Popillia japonica]|uniref:Uncharacterized protein n=1 Tax=Popillia japonica TaxID=7064 RepID=A0AAW1ITX3_POPJA